MGHYYNPPQPFAGGRQPAAPGPKLTPSGPTPDNPPISGGARIPAAVLSRWIPAPADQVLFTRLTASAPPAPDNPPINGGARVSREVLSRWIPAQADQVLFTKLPLATAVAAPDNPPLNGGARVSSAVLSRWIPAPVDQVIFTRVQPTSGQAPDAPPPLARISPAIMAHFKWPVPPAGAVGIGIGVDNPPFDGGAHVQTEVLTRWVPSAPDPVFYRHITASGILSQNPPINGGARVPRAVLNRWIPPDPDRVYRRAPTFMFPNGSGPSGTLQVTEGDDTASQRLSDIIQPYVPKRYPLIPGGEARHISDELRSVSTAFNRLLELSKELDARIASLGG